MGKSASEISELLDNLGQESEEKGAKVALDLYEEERKENDKRDIKTVEHLTNSREKAFDSTYYKSILAECNMRMKEYDLPRGFRWAAKVSKEGLAIYIEDPFKHQYGGGVKITMDPFTDAKGVVGIINQALIDVELLHQKWKMSLSTKTKN